MRLFLLLLLNVLVLPTAIAQLEGNYVYTKYGDEPYLRSYIYEPTMVNAFTLEYYVQVCDPLPQYNYVLASMGYDLAFMYYHSSKSVAFKVSNGNTSSTAQFTSNVIDIDTVSHIAFTYQKNSTYSATVKFFFNGYLTAAINYGGSASLPTSSSMSPTIGALISYYPTVPAYIDQFRLSNTLRYIQNFIPDSILTVDQATRALWDFNTSDTLTNGKIIHNDIVNNHILTNNADYIYQPQIITPSGNLSSTMDTICKGDTLFAKGGFNSCVFNWSPGHIFSDSTIANPVILIEDTSTIITLAISDSLMCRTHYDSLIIYIPPPSVYQLSADTIICYNDSLELFVNTVNNFYWDKHQAVQDTLAIAQMIQIDSSSNFYINIYTVSQCITRDSVQIVISKPYPEIHSDSIICYGDSLLAIATGGSNYFWEPVGIASDSQNDTTFIYPLHDTTLLLIVEDTLGCFDTSFHYIKVGATQFVNISDTTLCDSGYIDLPNNFITINWNTGDTTSSIFIDTSGTFHYSIVDSFGCSVSDSINALVFQSPLVSIFSRDIICEEDSVLVRTDSMNNQIISWWPGNAFVDSANHETIFLSGSGIDSISLTVMDTITGCIVKLNKKYILLSDCVWPGDANNDYIVDNHDLLSIGLGFNYSDSLLSRQEATLFWRGQAAVFHDTLPSGLNYKYLNTNGDAIINDEDTLAIHLNYGFQHNKNASINFGSQFDPPLFSKTSTDTVKVNELVTFSVNLGDSTILASSVYGIAFSLELNSALIDPGSLMTDFSSNWIQGNQHFLKLMKLNSNSNQIDIALVRTDQKNISGYGKIADVSMLVEGFSGLSSDLLVSFSDVKLIDSAGNLLPVNPLNLSLPIGLANTIISPQPVIIFPNPSKGKIALQSSELISDIFILDLAGREVGYQKVNSKNKELDISDLSAGIYVFRIYINNKIYNTLVAKGQ